MKAATFKQYGDPTVLKVENIETPKPNSNEILVKINTTSLTSGDRRIRAADPFIIRFIYGINKPKQRILGHEFAGIVEEIGSEVKDYKVGDRVFGSTDMKSGTHAEYITVEERGVIAKSPDNVPDAQLAIMPVGALTAKFFLNKLGDLKGKKIMIYGASGSVGTYAVQIATLMGATVSAVCSKSRNEVMRTLGAKEMIDYKDMDFKYLNDKYDHIFDAVGLAIFNDLKHLLIDGGKFTTVAINPGLLFNQFLNKNTIELGVTKQTKEDLNYLAKLIEQGDILPVIDREFDLDDIKDAHTYVDRGHKFGNVLININ